MKNLHLDAGDFKQKIVLQSNQTIADGCGGFENNWINEVDVWARILVAKASSVFRAESTEPLLTHLIDVRQPLDIQAGMRLAANNPTRNFVVLTVYDPDETGRYWRCECRLEVEN